MRVSFQRSVLIVVATVAACWSVDDALDRAAASEISSLSGYVYIDQSFDGSWDPNVEWVLPGVELVLTKDDANGETLTTVTNNAGYYEFTDLDTGTYRIIQPALPGGYLNVSPSVGRLWDIASGQPSSAFPGYRVEYDQGNGIPAQVAGIELPIDPTAGTQYDFGQYWTGKAWYLGGGSNWTKPPGGRPPAPIPEPSAAILLIVGVVLLTSWRRLAAPQN